MKLLTEDFSITTTTEREMARDVKEMWCYISLDGYTGRKSTAEITDKEKTYEIPVGIIITVSAIRFCCFEVLLHHQQGNQRHAQPTFSRASWSSVLASAVSCIPPSNCQVVLPLSVPQ